MPLVDSLPESSKVRTVSEPTAVSDLIQSKLGATYAPPLETLADAVMAAYDYYEKDVWPSIDGYTTLHTIHVWESLDPVKFGFAATNGLCNVIAMRGTETIDETAWVNSQWDLPADLWLTDGSGNSAKYGKVQPGLISFYQDGESIGASLANHVKDAVTKEGENGKMDTSLPLFVVAHSLGGPLANLAALDLLVSGTYPSSPIVVTFGSLHVGDQSFFEAYSGRVPFTFRFANLCDFVPSIVGLMPPSQDPPPPPSPYVHVGLPICFVWQKWDDWANHSMENTYRTVVSQFPGIARLWDPEDQPYPPPQP